MRHFRCFRSSVFRGSEELPWVLTLSFLTFQIFFMHKNVYALKERKRNEKA